MAKSPYTPTHLIKRLFTFRIEGIIQTILGREKLSVACTEGAKWAFTEWVVLERFKKYNNIVKNVSLLKQRTLQYQFDLNHNGTFYKLEADINPITSNVIDIRPVDSDSFMKLPKSARADILKDASVILSNTGLSS